LFKECKGLPPFSPDWFGCLQDPQNPLGGFRLAWILLNQGEDERVLFEKEKSAIEYGGFFANPDVYFQVKNIPRGEPEGSRPPGAFKIIYDTAAFDDRMAKALKGEMVIKPQNQKVADLVTRKREELAAMHQKPDSRIVQYPTDEDYADGDDLVIERVDPTEDK